MRDPHLEGEYNSNVVIVQGRVRTNVESSLEVQTSQLGTAYSNARGAVDQLLYLLALVPELPPRLGLPPGVLPHGDGLDGSEVRPVDLCVTGTGVELV